MRTTAHDAAVGDNKLLPHNIDPIPKKENESDLVEENENNIDDEDDLHEIQVDDDLGEPDAEGNYPATPASDKDLPSGKHED
jgi:hypothetical protein